MYKQFVLVFVALSVGLVHSLDNYSITIAIPESGNCSLASGYTFTEGSKVTVVLGRSPYHGEWRQLNAQKMYKPFYYPYFFGDTVTVKKYMEGIHEFAFYFLSCTESEDDGEDYDTALCTSVCRTNITIARNSTGKLLEQEVLDNFMKTAADTESISILIQDIIKDCTVRSAGYTFKEGSDVTLVVDLHFEQFLADDYWLRVTAPGSRPKENLMLNRTMTIGKAMEGIWEFDFHYEHRSEFVSASYKCRTYIAIARDFEDASLKPVDDTEELLDNNKKTAVNDRIAVVLPVTMSPGNCTVKSAGYTFSEGSDVTLAVEDSSFMYDAFWLKIFSAPSGSLRFNQSLLWDQMVKVDKSMEGIWEFKIAYMEFKHFGFMACECRTSITIVPPQGPMDETAQKYGDLMTVTTTERSSSPEPAPQEALNNLTTTAESKSSDNSNAPTKNEIQDKGQKKINYEDIIPGTKTESEFEKTCSNCVDIDTLNEHFSRLLHEQLQLTQQIQITLNFMDTIRKCNSSEMDLK